MDNRRKFLQQSATLISGMALWPAIPIGLKQYVAKYGSPSDSIRIAAIGINGMGWTNVLAAIKQPGVRIVALCDIDAAVLEKRKAELVKIDAGYASIETYPDYRKVLDRKDVDAVIIGTPDHWHALIMIEATMAGKHVYVEKPAGNSIGECMAMVAAQKKYGNIVQVGQWQRSQQHFMDAVNFIKGGSLGNIRTVKVWCYQGWMKPMPVMPDSQPPAGVDFVKWLGPAPTRPFNASRFHFNFRWFWDYAGGLMTDWGVHLLDYALLGMAAPAPNKVVSLGGKFAYPELAEETPDTLTALYEFPGFNLVWDHAMGIDNGSYGKDHGIAYIGNNGTLVLTRQGWEVIEEKQSQHKVARPWAGVADNGIEKHWENFIGAVRSGNHKVLHCPIEDGAYVATMAQLGNISFRSGEAVMWDGEKQRLRNARQEKDYWMKAYQNGYKLPVIS